MIKNIRLAISIASILLFVQTEAQPIAQSTGKCADPQSQAAISYFLNGVWLGIVEMNETGIPDPTKAVKALSASQIHKIQDGIHSNIIEIYARTNDNKLPAECFAIVKSTIAWGNKTLNTPTYPVNYGVHQRTAGAIDIDINSKSLDMDLVTTVTKNVALLSQQK
jgi:hypothetical protein